MSKRQRKERFAEENPPQARPDRFVGGQEEAAAWGQAFTTAVPEEASQPAPTPADEPIDLSDPDAKAAWLDLLSDAFIAGDNEQVKKLQAMIPEDTPELFGEEGNFSGIITDRLGRKRKYVNGKAVPMDGDGGDGGDATKPGAKKNPGSGKPSQSVPELTAESVTSAIAKGRAGDDDPLGQRSAGFPAGVNKDEFLNRISAAVDKEVKRITVGPRIDMAYSEAGGGMSKADFIRALVAAHDAGKIRLSGWSKSVGELPDPSLAVVLGGKLFYYIQPGY
jgi:hypothetical protein